MTDPDNRLSTSAPGPFYVDARECIACGNCAYVAPTIFSSEGKEDDLSYMVSKQPETDEEREQVHQAIDECPVSAIGECTGE